VNWQSGLHPKKCQIHFLEIESATAADFSLCTAHLCAE
jgi:hypothetical protein